MKAMFVLVAVALLVVMCEGNTHMTAMRNNIMSEAHTCCVSSSCSVEQKASIRSRMDIYDGPDAQSTRDYVEQALSGAACTDHGRKRVVGDIVNFKCNYTGPIDVQYGDVYVMCTVNVSMYSGIFSVQVYGSIYIGKTYKTVNPDNGGYLDQLSRSTTFNATYVLRFQRYSPYGNWSLLAVVYGQNGKYSITNSTTVVVLKTKNDMAPPTLTALAPSVFNINDDNNAFVFSAVDDFSGVSSVGIYCQNASGVVGYAVWSGSLQTSLTAAAPLILHAGTVPGTYTLYADVFDAVGFFTYYYQWDLASANLISSITLDINNCTAGTYRAYNTTGTCSTCGVGTYSKAGAFKCNSCPPGTYSANSTTCLPCPAGTSGIGASWACSPCAAGTYTSSSGNSVCSPCSPGYNSSITGSQSCSSCPAGTYSYGGTGTCSACAPGTYSTGGSFLCAQCVPGTYTSTYGASACQPCPPGTFSWVGFASCTACPSPTYNGPLGSNSRLNCY